MDRHDEEDLLMRMLLHPAGFNIGLFDCIHIRSHSDGYEVSWIEDLQSNTPISYSSMDFVSLQSAVEFFVDKRHELKIGLDIEAELLKKNGEVPT